MIEKIPANIWTKEDLSEYQIFDVRTPLEWESGILPNAKCVFLYDNYGFLNPKFVDEIKLNLIPDKKLALICRSGHRSLIAAEILAKELNIKSYSLDGGMLALRRF